MQTVGQDSVEDWTASITCRQWDSKTVLKTGQLVAITCRQWDKTVLKTGQLVLHADSGTVRQC